MYLVDNNTFYPDSGSIEIYHDDASNDPDILAIEDNLNILIPTGHHLDYKFTTDTTPGAESFILIISSLNNFDIVKGSPIISYKLDKNGKIENTTF